MTDQDKAREANKRIAELLREVESKLKEATDIADDAGVDICWDGPTYGMGGSYTPKRKDEFDSSSSRDDEYEGWNSSSAFC